MRNDLEPKDEFRFFRVGSFTLLGVSNGLLGEAVLKPLKLPK